MSYEGPQPYKSRPAHTAAVCPFWLKDARKSVTCEGAEPGTLLSVKTGTEAALRKYKQRYCCSYSWKDCMVAQILLITYGEQRTIHKREEKQ